MEINRRKEYYTSEKTLQMLEEMGKNCVICKRKIGRVQFKLIIRKALSRKHNLSLRLFSIQIMNQIINQSHTGIYVQYRERTKYEIMKEHLKRYYSNSAKLKSLISVNNNTEEPRPKLYLKKYRGLVNKWAYNKQKLRKKRLKLKSRAKK